MLLIGQYDSPFVRRVAVALQTYELAYEHQPWSTFSDAEALAQFNPLTRVPTLVLDDGETLVESGAILDHLDELVGPSVALVPRSGPSRRAILKICALATGACDKMVSLIYERALHDVVSAAWIARCETQINAVLDHLERDLSGRPGLFWLDSGLSHADVVVACAMRLLREAHGGRFDHSRWPALTRHSEICESLDAFQAVVQPFLPPSR
jgi:glutathione S-transferase